MATKPVSGIQVNYTEPNSGITITGAWVDISNILYVPSNYCLIVFDVYKDRASKDGGKSPIFPSKRVQEEWNSPNWNLFFDCAVMDQPNKDVQAQVVSYLQLINS